jgi:hypothetical protein
VSVKAKRANAVQINSLGNETFLLNKVIIPKERKGIIKTIRVDKITPVKRALR